MSTEIRLPRAWDSPQSALKRFRPLARFPDVNHTATRERPDQYEQRVIAFVNEALLVA
jgi:pimeloyl-ACP methyl ester carboxylesterase